VTEFIDDQGANAPTVASAETGQRVVRGLVQISEPVEVSERADVMIIRHLPGAGTDNKFLRQTEVFEPISGHDTVMPHGTSELPDVVD